MSKLYLLLIVLFMVSASHARSFRVNQIPNGTKFSCTTCHTGYGGPRNDFGLQIYNNYLNAKTSTGNVLWGPELATANADQDAATNGEELQDPAGTWQIGNAAPGDLAMVSNPGDPNSTTGIAHDLVKLPNSVDLHQNYPNPFNPKTHIQFNTPQAGFAVVQIYNTAGQLVNTLVNEYIPAGQHSVTWNGLDDKGLVPVSGIYLYRLQINGQSITRQMLYLK